MAVRETTVLLTTSSRASTRAATAAIIPVNHKVIRVFTESRLMCRPPSSGPGAPSRPLGRCG